MLKINNKNIRQMRIDNKNIKLAKMNGQVVFNQSNSAFSATYQNDILQFEGLKSGTYDFYYADENGIISDYDKICTLTVEENNTAQYNYFNSLNIAPEQTINIVACNTETTTVVASTSLPDSLKLENKSLGNKKYSVGLLSDIHCDGDGTDEAYAEEDFRRALEYYQDKVDFVGICGDVACSTNNTADYTIYKSIVQDYTLPIQVISGNHDVNLDFTNALEINNCNKYIYNDDVYLFLSCMAWSSSNPIFSDQITWLQEQFETYKNQRVFFFFHFFMNPVRKRKQYL